MNWYVAWGSLPEPLRRRWAPLRRLAERCFGAGMRFELYSAKQITHLSVSAPPHWLGGRAVYYSPAKVLAMTQAVAYGTDPGYGAYRGDVHELGHAVWFLLLSAKQKWEEYHKLWTVGGTTGTLVPYNGQPPNVEESWAQDFEALFTTADVTDYAGWGRGRFRAVARRRYDWVAGVLRALGGDVDRTVDGRKPQRLYAAFPVRAAHKYDFSDGWGDPRPGGRGHKGTDVFAREGTDCLACVDGEVTRIGNDGGAGGNRLWLNGAHYYAHLLRYAPGIVRGKRVRAGDVVGYVDRTGKFAATTPPHLHVGLDLRGTHGLHWENPYPYLVEALS